MIGAVAPNKLRMMELMIAAADHMMRMSALFMVLMPSDAKYLEIKGELRKAIRRYNALREGGVWHGK